MSHASQQIIEQVIDAETLEFMRNKGLLMDQLKHAGLNPEDFYKKGLRMTPPDMAAALRMEVGEISKSHYTVRDGQGVSDAEGLAQLLQVLSGTDDNAIVQKKTKEPIAKVQVVPGARGFTMIEDVDIRHKNGVLSYEGKPEYKDKIVNAAHKVAVECELGIVTMYAIIRKGEVVVIDVDAWTEPIPACAAPYVIRAVENAKDAREHIIGYIGDDLISDAKDIAVIELS